MTTRRSLLASLGLALPAVAAATGASAATTTAPRHAKPHGHVAHAQHHAKPHRTASAKHAHAKQA
jgi:hypothetical protein